MATALNCGDRMLDLTSPCIMGILNVTPDSFSDGGLFISAGKNSEAAISDSAEEHCKLMARQGAAIIDIGGESTRPGAEPVSAEDELNRVIPVVKRIKAILPETLISVDTSKPEVMKIAIASGAHIINDVNALQQSGALELVASSKAAVCLMHMQGQPRTMQNNPKYNNVVEDVYRFLSGRVEACLKAGMTPDRIIIDPGFGFGKSLDHNLQLFKNLQKFKELGVALLVGVSRKTMIGTLLDKPVHNRVSGSTGLAALAVWLGADILRVHDVDETRDAIKVTHAVMSIN